MCAVHVSTSHLCKQRTGIIIYYIMLYYYVSVRWFIIFTQTTFYTIIMKLIIDTLLHNIIYETKHMVIVYDDS